MNFTSMLWSPRSQFRVLLAVCAISITAAFSVPSKLAAYEGGGQDGLCFSSPTSCCRCFSGEGGTCERQAVIGHTICETTDGVVFCGTSGGSCYRPTDEV